MGHTPPIVKRKVLAYITREHNDQMELLVFKHRDHPEAGLQVPGGTVEDSELLIDALYREPNSQTKKRFFWLIVKSNATP